MNSFGREGWPVEPLKLALLPQRFAVCRLDPDTTVIDWPVHRAFWSITRTNKEISIVLPEEDASPDWQAERGWRCLQVLGPLDFDLTGVLASLSAPLARARIPTLALSTYDTDYILVRGSILEEAKRALEAYGHLLVEYTDG